MRTKFDFSDLRLDFGAIPVHNSVQVIRSLPANTTEDEVILPQIVIYPASQMIPGLSVSARRKFKKAI